VNIQKSRTKIVVWQGLIDVLGLAQMVTKKKRKCSVDCVLEEGSSGMQSAITVEINRSWLRSWIRFRRL